MVQFLIFIMLITVIMTLSMSLHLSIRSRSKRVDRHTRRLHDAIFSREGHYGDWPLASIDCETGAF